MWPTSEKSSCWTLSNVNQKKKEIPEGGDENLELLERLFEARVTEIEPDLVSELNILIDNVCELWQAENFFE